MPFNSTLSSINFSTEAPANTTELFLESDGLKIFRLSLFSLVIFASLLGNFIICKTVWEIPHRKPFSYYLVANLAVAELINSLCTLFIMVYMEKGSWIFGKAMCILVNPLLVLSMFVITNSLATVAVYRYRVMLDKTRPTGLVMTGIIVGIWMMALAITLPLFITRKLVQMPEKYFTCQSYFPGDIVPNTANYNKYTIVRLVFTFAVPYFVILSTYIALAIKLKLYVRQIAKEDDYVGIGLSDSPAICGAKPGNASNPRRMDDNIEPVETEDNTRKRRRNGKMLIDTAENYLLRTVFVIILIFLACYIPYQGFFLWDYFGNFDNWQFYYHKLLLDYLFILKCLPSALHPICYATMNSIFTRGFARVVKCPC